MQKYLFLILLAFLAVGIFFPIIGLFALVCMLAPVALAIWKGRFWCGNFCPRGSFYDHIGKFLSSHRPMPQLFFNIHLRIAVILVLMSGFSWQVYKAWPYPEAIGAAFIKMILITTIIGLILGAIYHERSWCAFCPMGTLSALTTPSNNQRLYVADSCINCTLCSKACPFHLKPYLAKGNINGYLENDCIKCGRCIKACPKQALILK